MKKPKNILATPPEEYVAPALHYSPFSILTKNGELMQTLKVTGFTYELVGNEYLDLRNALRVAVLRSIPDTSYALWFHTIRRRKSLYPSAQNKSAVNSFAAKLSNRWRESNKWDDQFVNSVYITIVKEAQAHSIGGFKGFIRGLWPSAERNFRMEYLSHANQQLEEVVIKMMNELEPYGVQRLGMYDDEEQIFSHNLSFFDKIINQEDREWPVADVDLADYLLTKKITFKSNQVESAPITPEKDSGKKQTIGAMLSVKDYVDVSGTAVDKLLQLPQEMIVTQSCVFVDQKIAQKQLNKIKYYYEIGDTEMMKLMNLDKLASNDHNLPTYYAQQQTMIYVYGDSQGGMEENLARTINAFSDIGLQVLREDVRLEDCFWGQIPGNFEFLKRQKPIATSWIGGFASLHNFPAGKAVRNFWGPAVTVFRTALKTPYFFNFHDVSGNGHTTIIGPNGSGKTVLLNFLISESLKYGGKVFFFDFNNASKIFINAISGSYKDITGELHFNPLSLPDTPENRGFLGLWLSSLLRVNGYMLTDVDINAAKKAIEYNYQQPLEQRNLANVQKYFTEAGYNTLNDQIKYWTGGGIHKEMFNSNTDNLNFEGNVFGFETSKIAGDPELVESVLVYMLHRINQELDAQKTSKPAIVVLDEAWRLLENNKVMEPILESWLDGLKSRNAIAILTTESGDEAANSPLSSRILQKITTQIYLPNEFAGEEYIETFKLTEIEYQMILSLSKKKRQFMLRHLDDSVVCELNLGGSDGLLRILSADAEGLVKMEEMIEKHGANPALWLDEFIADSKTKKATA